MKLTVNQAIHKFMKLLGIRYIFGIPGSNMGLIHSLMEDNDIRTILTKHECGAAFMASGYTKASGHISACFGTVGPGAMNLVTGVAAAFMDSQPILVLSGQVPKSYIGKNALQEATGLGRTICQIDVFKKITLFSGRISDINELTPVLKQVYRHLHCSRPGPVFIEIGADIMDEVIVFDLEEITKDENNAEEINKDSTKQIEKVANLLILAKRPLILAGAGAIYNNLSKEINKLAEILHCPVATSLKGKGIISEEHPLALGTIGISGQDCANKYLEQVDVLLAVGASFHQCTTKAWQLPFEEKKIIRIDVEDDTVTRNYTETISLKGNMQKIIDQLVSVIGKKSQSLIDNKDINFDLYKKNTGYFNYPKMFDHSTPMKPQRFMNELREILPPNTIVCSESVVWTGKYFRIYEPRTHIVATGLAPIGCSLPEAIGAKLAHPDRVVVSIQGDAGFQMLGIELMTAINYKIPIIAIVLNNGILGPIYHTQQKKYGKTFCCEFRNPDFVKMAESFGMVGLRIKEANEIQSIMLKAVEMCDKYMPVLIDVVIDPEEVK